jgi:hypothetical protein
MTDQQQTVINTKSQPRPRARLGVPGSSRRLRQRDPATVMASEGEIQPQAVPDGSRPRRLR